MNRILATTLAAAAGTFALAAHATLPAPHITNGGTGYIGLTASAGTDWHPMQVAAADRLPAGEASTLIDGRPNANPDAPQAGTSMAQPAQGTAMGAASSPMGERRPITWGTPD